MQAQRRELRTQHRHQQKPLSGPSLHGTSTRMEVPKRSLPSRRAQGKKGAPESVLTSFGYPPATDPTQRRSSKSLGRSPSVLEVSAPNFALAGPEPDRDMDLGSLAAKREGRIKKLKARLNEAQMRQDEAIRKGVDEHLKKMGLSVHLEPGFRMKHEPLEDHTHSSLSGDTV